MYLAFLVAGAALAALIWLVAGGLDRMSFTTIITIPAVILFLAAFVGRAGGPLPGADHARDVFGVMNHTRDRGLANDFSLSAGQWVNRRLFSIAAVGSGITLLGAGALLYLAFGIR